MAPNQCFHKYITIILVFHSLAVCVTCYEKTLRKIVRNQVKMVQRPFDDATGITTWTNVSNTHPLRLHSLQLFPSMQTQYKTMKSSKQPRTAALLATIEATPGKSYIRTKSARIASFHPNEVRLARNTFLNSSKSTEVLLSEKTRYNVSTRPAGVIIEDIHPISMPSFFPPVDGAGLDNKDGAIVIPDDREHFKYNESLRIQGLIRRNVTKYTKPEEEQKQHAGPTETDIDNEKADFLFEGSTVPTLIAEKNNTPPLICTIVKTRHADIDAQSLFAELDIEPPWMAKKHFWNNIFDSRYESLMRNAKWPPLKVILVPRTHVYSIWKKTFEQYNNSASKILSNIVKKLQFYSNLTFTWNEVSHLSRWWKSASQKNRMAFRRLLKGGSLEITTGGWVESDEATTHFFGLIHLLIEGHQWLQKHLHYSPRVAWLTNTVTHSPTMAYLLSSLGITNLVFTNIHYAWEKYLAEYQVSEFVWLQNWSGKESFNSYIHTFMNRMGRESYPKSSIIAHYLQFNSDGFKACGPKKDMCSTEFNFAQQSKNFDINSYNVKEKSELLLEQYSKTGTITPHNVVIAPIGCPHCFEDIPEFDYQYNNYLKIADYVNINRDIYKATVQFGTPSDFFRSITKRNIRYPTLKGDFMNFADVENGSPAYWVGFFTSRPLLKILLRRLQSTLRSTEILFSFAVSRNAFRGLQTFSLLELLVKSREAVAQLLDRNVISGTLTANTVRVVHEKILATVRDCWSIQEIAVSALTSKKPPERPYLQKHVYRDGEFISTFRTVGPGDELFIFNSLSQERTEVVELYTRSPNIRILNQNRRDVTLQVNPVWKYNSDNVIVISRRFYKITFAVDVLPLTLELYKIKQTSYAATQNVATIYCVSCIIDDITNNATIFPFNIQSIETGDIQLESYKHRLIFDEISGFLKSIVEKDTNIEKPVVLDYGAFRSSGVNSGMFLFNTNVSKPLHDILMPYRLGKKSKLVIIVSGHITTELSSIYGRLLQHTVKIFNVNNSPLSNAIYIESKVDYEISPKYRDLELFLSIQTDIANGNAPEIYTDNNGFQYTARVLNMSRRVESNVYPMTTMSFIQDRRRRLTCVTEHAQGVTALQEGQLVLLLDRRALRDDARGAGEGLADGGPATHRHYILLENIAPPISLDHSFVPNTLQLPSLRANYLSNTINYLLDFFVLNRTQIDRYHYIFLPLIKSEFPCDVSLINFRLIIDSDNLNTISAAALMILHRQSYSCQIDNDVVMRCGADTAFVIDNILRNFKSIYQTNLCGSSKGPQVNTINLANFPSMELLTLRVHL